MFWRNSWVGTGNWRHLENGAASSDSLHTNDRSFPSSLLSLLEPFSEQWRSLVCLRVLSEAPVNWKCCPSWVIFLTCFSQGGLQLYPLTFFNLARLAQVMDICPISSRIINGKYFERGKRLPLRNILYLIYPAEALRLSAASTQGSVSTACVVITYS
jgi:hypothetical protein